MKNYNDIGFESLPIALEPWNEEPGASQDRRLF
jgi:hypothetical protein